MALTLNILGSDKRQQPARVTRHASFLRPARMTGSELPQNSALLLELGYSVRSAGIARGSLSECRDILEIKLPG